jgi:hypothetical protein
MPSTLARKRSITKKDVRVEADGSMITNIRL